MGRDIYRALPSSIVSWRRNTAAVLGAAIVLVCAALAAAQWESTEEVTPNDEFFYVSITDPLQIDASEWRLVVNGTVERPYTLTYEQLTAMPNVTVNATLRCVDGPSGRAAFTGVRLSHLLEAAGVREGSVKVAFRSPDGYSTDLRLEDAMLDDVLLAYKMNNETLPAEQGYPARLVVPEQWGYKWAKWVTEIEVVDYDFKGYWESRGWADDAYLDPRSDWWWHALGLTAATVVGGFVGVTGAVDARRRDRGKERLFPPKVHRAAGYAYTLLTLAIFAWWAVETFSLKTNVFYSLHGLLAATGVILGSLGMVAGALLARGSGDARGPHWFLAVVGFGFVLLAVATGLSLAY